MSGIHSHKPSFVLWLVGALIAAPGLITLIVDRFDSGPAWAYLSIVGGVAVVFLAAYLHDADHERRGEPRHALMGRR
jgi:hypothetical protein